MTTSYRKKILIGFLLAPIVPALIAFIVVYKSSVSIYENIWFLSSILLIGYATMFSIGMPAYFIANSRGYSSITAYLIGGAVIGGMLSLAFIIPAQAEATKLVLFFVFYGAIASTTFWGISVRNVEHK